jgi:membrane fusion protein, multidrug efflux system
MTENAQAAVKDAGPERDEPTQNGSDSSSGKEPAWKQLNRRNPNLRLFLLIGGIVLIAAGLLMWRYLSSYESTDDAQVYGHLDPVSARVAGQVQKLLVNDNQYVTAGSPLVQIDPSDYEVALEKAKADYADAQAMAAAARVNVPITSVNTGSQTSAAEADVEDARSGIAAARQQADAAAAQQQAAEANNAKAQSDLARYQELVAKQEISQQQFDQATAAARANAAAVVAAKASAAAAQQQVRQAQAKLAVAQANLRATDTAPQQIEAIRSRAQSAEAQVQQKKAALDQAQLNLGYTTIVAPVNGIVSNRTVEVGQNVQPGQELLQVINLDDVWVVADFKETQLKRMKAGQQVTIHVDTTGKDYKGHVQSMAGGSGAIFSLLPPENATGNYVKVVQRIPVKITFDAGQTSQHDLVPGMSVEPKVWLKQ